MKRDRWQMLSAMARLLGFVVLLYGVAAGVAQAYTPRPDKLDGEPDRTPPMPVSDEPANGIAVDILGVSAFYPHTKGLGNIRTMSGGQVRARHVYERIINLKKLAEKKSLSWSDNYNDVICSYWFINKPNVYPRITSIHYHEHHTTKLAWIEYGIEKTNNPSDFERHRVIFLNRRCPVWAGDASTCDDNNANEPAPAAPPWNTKNCPVRSANMTAAEEELQKDIVKQSDSDPSTKENDGGGGGEM